MLRESQRPKLSNSISHQTAGLDEGQDQHIIWKTNAAGLRRVLKIIVNYLKLEAPEGFRSAIDSYSGTAATVMTSNSSSADEFQSERNSRSASRSRAQTPPPRPTTPLRPPSRNSLRSSQTPTHGGVADGNGPLAALEGPFGELSDSMADLEANFVHLQLMHESLARFSECFASFLYGLNVNAFCVDFPEARTRIIQLLCRFNS